ncbi:MAG: tripartite tricarboxylate transporter TctB family protein [Actinomycetota bacterium]|nr:tripartite tricarboxylate transporter TctB family protein [Actinomycetota bacterium]
MTIHDHRHTETQAGSAPPQRLWSGRSALVMPVLLVALGVLLIYGIADMELADDSEVFGPRVFPAITAGFCFLVAALLTLSVLRNPELPEAELSSNWRSTATTFGSFAAFAVLLVPAGWIIAGAVVFWGVTVGLGSRRYVPNLLIGLAASSVMQLVFSGALGLSLPPGVMGIF